jgi:RimJ/RimL family protein N-acetyltransferase
MLGPILRGKKISLEPIQHDDLEQFRRWLADPQVTRYLLTRFVPSAKSEEEWYEKAASDQASVYWSIILDGRAIGVTSLNRIDWLNRHAISGLFIGEVIEWGKGYASEVVQLRTIYAFEELGLERLETESLTENIPMHRALEKVGYQKIGQRRHYTYRGGRWHDAYIFELLHEEWLTRQDRSLY